MTSSPNAAALIDISREYSQQYVKVRQSQIALNYVRANPDVSYATVMAAEAEYRTQFDLLDSLEKLLLQVALEV